ncbi:MAG: hypothetical protein RBT59_02850 [Arcobacteraceae bacterium]|jgi:hypothetical protein|nr:hypothetical protein [Arcobacteraceae bacterium]
MTPKQKLKKLKELTQFYNDLNCSFFAMTSGFMSISDYVLLVNKVAPKIDELKKELNID